MNVKVELSMRIALLQIILNFLSQSCAEKETDKLNKILHVFEIYQEEVQDPGNFGILGQTGEREKDIKELMVILEQIKGPRIFFYQEYVDELKAILCEDDQLAEELRKNAFDLLRKTVFLVSISENEELHAFYYLAEAKTKIKSLLNRQTEQKLTEKQENAAKNLVYNRWEQQLNTRIKVLYNSQNPTKIQAELAAQEECSTKAPDITKKELSALKKVLTENLPEESKLIQKNVFTHLEKLRKLHPDEEKKLTLLLKNFAELIKDYPSYRKFALEFLENLEKMLDRSVEFSEIQKSSPRDEKEYQEKVKAQLQQLESLLPVDPKDAKITRDQRFDKELRENANASGIKRLLSKEYSIDDLLLMKTLKELSPSQKNKKATTEKETQDKNVKEKNKKNSDPIPDFDTNSSKKSWLILAAMTMEPKKRIRRQKEKISSYRSR